MLKSEVVVFSLYFSSVPNIILCKGKYHLMTIAYSFPCNLSALSAFLAETQFYSRIHSSLHVHRLWGRWAEAPASDVTKIPFLPFDGLSVSM